MVEVTLRRRRGKVISWAGVARVALELRTTVVIMRRSRIVSEKVRAIVLIINIESY